MTNLRLAAIDCELKSRICRGGADHTEEDQRINYFLCIFLCELCVSAAKTSLIDL